MDQTVASWNQIAPWLKQVDLAGHRMSFGLTYSDVVHETIFEAVVPGADLLADDPPDLGLNSGARPRLTRGCVRFRQRSSNMPNQFADRFSARPSKRPGHGIDVGHSG